MISKPMNNQSMRLLQQKTQLSFRAHSMNISSKYKHYFKVSKKFVNFLKQNIFHNFILDYSKYRNSALNVQEIFSFH